MMKNKNASLILVPLTVDDDLRTALAEHLGEPMVTDAVIVSFCAGLLRGELSQILTEAGPTDGEEG